jgi:hypothetical protein
MRNERYALMTQSPVKKLVLKMSGPTIISMLVTSFYNIIDAAICLSLVLVFLPRIGIPAYILILYTSELLNLLLSLHKLQSVLNRNT